MDHEKISFHERGVKVGSILFRFYFQFNFIQGSRGKDRVVCLKEQENHKRKLYSGFLGKRHPPPP